MIFNRYWAIKVRANPVFSFIPPFEFEIKPDENNRSLRAQFEINVTDNFNLNSGILKIKNLSAEKRALLSFNLLGEDVGTGPSIQIDAGYKTNHGFIFNGAITRGYSIKEGAEWTTHLRLGLPFKKDFRVNIAAQEINDANLFNFLYESVEKVKTQQNRIEIPNAADYKSSFQAAINNWLLTGNTKNKSLGYYGFASAIIAQIEKEFSLNFFYDYSGWNVVQVNSDDRTPEAKGDLSSPEFIFTPENGLLGSPVYTDTGAKIRVYLKPELKLFRVIGIRSEGLRKNISMNEIVHIGDTHSDEWYSEIDGAAYK